MQIADFYTQVSLSPHHPSCKTQGATSIKHKESLVRNKRAQPTTGSNLPTVGKGRMTFRIHSNPVSLQEKKEKQKLSDMF